MESDNYVSVPFFSTFLATLFTLRLSLSVFLRLKVWFQVLRESKVVLTTRRAAIEQNASQMLPNATIDSTRQTLYAAHKAVVAYFACSLMLCCMCLRCVICITLVALGEKTSPLTCNLLLQLLLVLYAVGNVFPYVFFWRRQRFLYFKLQQYSRLIRWWSWSAAFLTTCFILVQEGLYTPTWRYGIQHAPSPHGCKLKEYNSSLNVTLSEWNLPYIYSVAGATILLVLSVGLYSVLCYKCLISPNNRAERILRKSKHLKHQLICATIAATLSYCVPILVPLIFWKFVRGGCLAVLASQIRDLGFLIQITAMILTLDDWKEALRLQTSTSTPLITLPAVTDNISVPTGGRLSTSEQQQLQ